jgi:protein-S-isoprenylcysteine O-methyltransferase
MRLSLLLGLIYLISEVLLSVTRRGHSKAGEKQDRSTLRVIWIVIIISIGAGVFVARSTLLQPRPAGTAGSNSIFVLPYADVFAVAGVVLFAAGLLLRWWAIITLGRFFTVDVVVEKDHEVVERGPFRLVRHPSYTGVLLAFVGWALTLGNWGAMLVVLVPIFAVFIHRMNVEEQALQRALGDRYVSYMRRTKRLVPGVY